MIQMKNKIATRQLFKIPCARSFEKTAEIKNKSEKHNKTE